MIVDQKKRKYRRRRWRSEPGRRFHGLPRTATDISSTDEDSHDEDSPYESSSSEVDNKVTNQINILEIHKQIHFLPLYLVHTITCYLFSK